MRRLFTIFIFIIVCVIGATFAAINTHEVVINYYFGSLALPLSIIIILSIVIGLLLGAIAMMFGSLKRRYEVSQLQKKLSISEQELNSLRILPIKDEH